MTRADGFAVSGPGWNKAERICHDALSFKASTFGRGFFPLIPNNDSPPLPVAVVCRYQSFI
jgi:hypothetical protein